MKLNREDILGSFNGIEEFIGLGKNIHYGMLVFTRFHENFHKILNASTEIGYIIYFLKRDVENASLENKFEYCNKINSIIAILEKYMENISEIFANTCELLIAYEYGNDIFCRVKETKKGIYSNYCFLFDHMNNMKLTTYGKIGVLLNAAVISLQECTAEKVVFNSLVGPKDLLEQLYISELPEIVIQRILFGEYLYKQTSFELNDILDVLQNAGFLVYIKEYVELVKSEEFKEFSDSISKNKELMNFQFHKSAKYFDAKDIKCNIVDKSIIMKKKSKFAYLSFDDDGFISAIKICDDNSYINGFINKDEIKEFFESVDSIMYNYMENDRIEIEKIDTNNKIMIEYFDDYETFFSKALSFKENARYVSVSDSEVYAISIGCLIDNLNVKKINMCILNGQYNMELYKMIEGIGGNCYYTDNMMECFKSKELFFGFSFALVFLLQVTS
jgi:hypothetical protein